MQIQKKSLPLHPQLRDKGSETCEKHLEKGRKTRKTNFFRKNCKKVLSKFGSLKNLPYLCTTFGSEIESEGFWKRFFDLLVIFKRENVVFICQFPLMENEVVRTLTIHYNFLQWRVWSWLRMNASGRLNTCKSRGSIKLCLHSLVATGARVRNAYATYL